MDIARTHSLPRNVRPEHMTLERTTLVGVPVEISIDPSERPNDFKVDTIVGSIAAVIRDSDGEPYWVIDAESAPPRPPGPVTCYLVTSKAVGVTLERAFEKRDDDVAVVVGEVPDRSVLESTIFDPASVKFIAIGYVNFPRISKSARTRTHHRVR